MYKIVEKMSHDTFKPGVLNLVEDELSKVFFYSLSLSYRMKKC